MKIVDFRAPKIKKKDSHPRHARIRICKAPQLNL